MADQNLSNEELAVEIKKGNNREEYLCTLCARFRPLVQKMARQYSIATPEDRADYEQELYAELCAIVPKFDQYRGIKFVSFAFPWLHQAARKYRRQLYPVKYPDDVRKAVSIFLSFRDQGLSLREIREQTGWSPGALAEVERLSKTTLAPPLSTSAEYVSEDGSIVSLGDLIVDPDAERAYRDLFDMLDDTEIILFVQALPEPCRTVISQRFLSADRTSFKELAERLHISISEVKAAQRRGLKMIKSEFRRRGVIESIAYASTGLGRMERTFTSNVEQAVLQSLGQA